MSMSQYNRTATSLMHRKCQGEQRSSTRLAFAFPFVSSCTYLHPLRISFLLIIFYSLLSFSLYALPVLSTTFAFYLLSVSISLCVSLYVSFFPFLHLFISVSISQSLFPSSPFPTFSLSVCLNLSSSVPLPPHIPLCFPSTSHILYSPLLALVGMVVGYLAGGWVTRNYGYFAVFILMQSLSAISALLSVSVPETLPAARRQPAISWRQANIVAAAGVLARNANIAILAAIFVLQVATRLGIMGISVLYVRHMWNWRADLVSNYLAADSVAKGLALFATIPLAHRFLSRHSYWRQDITLIRVRRAAVQN